MSKKKKKPQKSWIVLRPLTAILIILLSFLGGIGCQRFLIQSNQQESQRASSSDEHPGSAIVSRVIDGDTVEIDSGQSVRLIGVAASGPGEPFEEEPKVFIQKLIEGKRVRLEYDAYKEDIYGRLLAYIWIKPDKSIKTLSALDDEGEVNVSLELARQGLAKVVIYKKRKTLIYQSELIEAEKLAKEEKLGVWSRSR